MTSYIKFITLELQDSVMVPPPVELVEDAEPAAPVQVVVGVEVAEAAEDVDNLFVKENPY
jgi:hypothetical protein